MELHQYSKEDTPSGENMPASESAAPFSITATDILEHLFCPRFSYFELFLVIPEHQEKRFTVQPPPWTTSSRSTRTGSLQTTAISWPSTASSSGRTWT